MNDRESEPRLRHTDSMLYAVLSGRYDRLIWGAVAIAAALVISKILRRVVASLEARHPDEERELARLRRGETALALIATAIPYVAAIVVLILAASAFLPGRSPRSGVLRSSSFWSASARSAS